MFYFVEWRKHIPPTGKTVHNAWFHFVHKTFKTLEFNSIIQTTEKSTNIHFTKSADASVIN